MPFYRFRCRSGHVTEEFRTISKYTETVRCSFRNPRCYKKAHIFLDGAPLPYNPQRIWTATEVHGKKKAASESFAADVEDACLNEKGLQR